MGESDDLPEGCAMADQEALAILRRGVKAWNHWRDENPSEPDLREADLTGAKLGGAILNHVLLNGAILNRADLEGADLTGAYLLGANLKEASVQRADLDHAELEEANLEKANLKWANLKSANLTGVNLEGANLSEANLDTARLAKACLRNAALGSARVEFANLDGADLSGANLSETYFRFARLTNANLAQAACFHTVFASTDLSNAKGLESIRHTGPSTIGIDTLYESRGTIPDSFLRGCGVPDTFITYAASLVVKPFAFYSCFISYSHKDEEFATRLHSRMQAEHLRVWYAPEDIEGGKKLHEQIDAAIRRHDKLLLLLSTNSMTSEWVRTEVYNARQRELKEKRQVLFPISLVPFAEIRAWEYFDPDTGKDLAREIREYFIPDFSNWRDHGVFEREFARLLRDLQAKPGKEG